MPEHECVFGHELIIFELRQKLRRREAYIIELENEILRTERVMQELVAKVEGRYFDLTEQGEDDA